MRIKPPAHLTHRPNARRIDYRNSDLRLAAQWTDGDTVSLQHRCRLLMRAVEGRALAFAADYETLEGTEYARFIRRFMA